MTGYQLLEKLKSLIDEELQKDVWFSNENGTFKINEVFIEEQSTYADAAYYDEIICERDYTKEELEEMRSCGEIVPLTTKGDIILTD